MMRHPVAEPLPKHCDPWHIARSKRHFLGLLPLKQTRELHQWIAGDPNMQVELEGYTDDQNHAHLKGQIQVTLQLDCQRCLEPMPWEATIEFDYLLLHSEAQENQIDDGIETFICAENEIDLAWFFEEEVLLAMPMIAKHETCSPPVDVSLKPTKQEMTTHNPFAQLKAMMNNKEQP